MSKKIVVISSYVDKLIRDMKPEIDFYLFKSISDLADYLKTEAIRADTLVITRDALNPVPSNALSVLNGILNEFYLKIEKVYYISEKGSSELGIVNFFIREERIDNWEIIPGHMTREFVTDFICGNIRGKDITPERRIVIRRKKSEWKREQIQDNNYLDEKYDTEEDLLSEIESLDNVPEISSLKHRTECNILSITGIDSKDRTLFYCILGQYLASSYKTLLIERDSEYHSLSDLIMKADIPCTKIRLSSIFLDINAVMHTIRMSMDKLIVIIVDTKDKFNYTFLSNVLYNNLSEDIDYILLENSFSELSTPDSYLVVIPNNVPDTLKTVEELPNGYKDSAKYVMIDSGRVIENKIINSHSIEVLMRDLLNYDDTEIEVPILEISSVVLKGYPQELKQFVK